MKYYETMNKEAVELSKALPEEKSELYKKFFVPLPLESFAKELKAAGSPEEEAGQLRAISDEAARNLNIKFDAAIGSATAIIKEGVGSIRVVKVSDLTDSQLMGRMYRSSDDRLVAFIHAYTKRLVFIEVPDGQKAELSLLLANTAPMVTQIIVNIGSGAELELLEWYASRTQEASLLGAIHEITVGKHSNAEMNLVHNEGPATYVVGFAKADVTEGAKLRMNFVYNGGMSTRVKNVVNANGYASGSEIVEMVMGSGEQKFDLNTVIANIGQDTVSDLGSKAALMDSAVCILKGFAEVQADARGSRSFVNERGILLDNRAYVSSIPGMSIGNANVKATHSSATAPVDEDSLFYLMSRGADVTDARKLLVSGFFSGSIAKMKSAVVKGAVGSLMNEKISGRRFGGIPMLNTSSMWFDTSQVDPDSLGGHYKYRDLR